MELWIAQENETGLGYQLHPNPQLPDGWLTAEGAYVVRLTGFTSADNLAGCHLLLGDVDQGAGRYERTDTLSWHWEAPDYVGQVTVGLERPDGGSFWPTSEVIVDPHRHKLTRDQFATMIEDINAEALLAYSLSPATRQVVLSQQQQHLELAQLEYLRRQIPALCRAVEMIARSPRRILFRESLSVPLAHSPAVDDLDIARIWQHSDVLQQPEPANVPVGAHALYQQMRGTLPERVSTGHQQISYDVYENRFLQHFLMRLSRVVLHTQIHLSATAQDSALDATLRALARRRLNELSIYRRMLYNVLDLDFLKGISPLRTIQPVTPTLRKDPAYARFYALYRQFDRAITPFSGGPFELSLEKTWQLYEYWCFFQVIAALRQLVGETSQFDARYLQPHADRVSLALPQAEVHLNDRLRVYFQKTYSYYGWQSTRTSTRSGTYSHEMRPDISIEIDTPDGKIAQIVVLDPKYRVSENSLNEAMNDLHRYKDAIIGADRRRLVQTALALCPTDTRGKALYFQEDYIRTHGLGGVVLCPGATDNVTSLATILTRLLPM